VLVAVVSIANYTIQETEKRNLQTSCVVLGVDRQNSLRKRWQTPRNPCNLRGTMKPKDKVCLPQHLICLRKGTL